MNRSGALRSGDSCSVFAGFGGDAAEVAVDFLELSTALEEVEEVCGDHAPGGAGVVEGIGAEVSLDGFEEGFARVGFARFVEKIEDVMAVDGRGHLGSLELGRGNGLVL